VEAIEDEQHFWLKRLHF